jgi:hypothetical protein
MPYRWHGRAQVDPSSPSAFGVCDRCGFLYNLATLQWQFQFNGVGLYNTRFLVCPTCLDVPQPQLLNPLLPPDPMPVMNARPEPYFLDEVTEITSDGSTVIVTEEGGDALVPNQPDVNFSEPPGE